MMSGWGTGFHWWAWALGIATTAVFWILVIWAIVALVRWARHDGNGPANPDGPRGPAYEIQMIAGTTRPGGPWCAGTPPVRSTSASITGV